MSDLLDELERIGREQDRLSGLDDYQIDGLGAGHAACGAFRRLLRHWPDGGAWNELEAAIVGVPEKFHGQIRESFDRGIDRCESPIEKSLFPWLLCQTYPPFNFNPITLLPGERARLIERSVAVVPQLPIGRYRADFALAISMGAEVKFVVIECDGREFHNHRRDKSRDREILKNDRILEICRLTGEEIFQDPCVAARKASESVARTWSVKR